MDKSVVTLDPASANFQDDDVWIGETPVGKGVFLRRRFLAEWVVGEFCGDVIEDSQYCSEYCVDLENGCQLEPDPPFRYVNHSCEPNCYFDWIDEQTDNGESTRRVYLIASREIAPGEELTIDYNWPAESAIPCQCATPSCRGWIVRLEEIDQISTRFDAQRRA